MSQLPESVRTRTKQYAASVVRFYVALPKTQEEVIVLAGVFGTSVARSHSEGISCSFRRGACLAAGAIREADKFLLWFEVLRGECSIAAALTKPLRPKLQNCLPFALRR